MVVNLLFVRQVALLLVCAFCLAVMLIAFDKADSQNAGIVIGACGSTLLLAAKGLIDYDDNNGE